MVRLNIVKRMKKESGFDKLKVIATGGLGGMISRETKVIDVYNPDLTLIGMQIIFAKQQKRK